MAPLCSRQSAPRPARGTLNVLQSDSNDSPAALFERGEIPGGLCADQAPEAELLAGDRDLAAGVVDDLDVEAGIGPALMQLTGRVQVTRAETVRDHTARLTTRSVDQRLELALAGGVDERLNRDVVSRARLRKEVAERASRLHVRLLSGRQYVVRLVLRRLHVRLVEGVDLKDRARDRGRELPAEELLAELV